LWRKKRNPHFFERKKMATSYSQVQDLMEEVEGKETKEEEI